ncbi:MAG: type II toxin-antitoxin system VapC family toxin [Gemmataceae bacterium]
MAYLVDLSILARLANLADTQFGVTALAVVELHRQGEQLYVTPGVLMKYRKIATRGLAQNGLGLSAVDADAQTATFEATFTLAADRPEIYTRWKSIVTELGLTGRQVDDALLVAVCHVHRISHLLTINVTHFKTFLSLAPGLTVVDPTGI